MDAVAALGLSPVFRTLDRRALRLLAEAAEWRELSGGRDLYRPGDPGDALYLIVSGRLRVLRSGPDGIPTPTAELGLGETIGVMSVVTGEPRSTSVMALRDTSLLRISKTHFEQLLRRYPDAMLDVTRLIIDRLRSRREPTPRDALRSARSFALLPAHDNIDMQHFAQVFCRQLADGGAVLRLDSKRVNAALGDSVAGTPFGDSEANRQLAIWLNRLEDRYRYVVYQAEVDPRPWTRRCLRQADRILVVADAAAPADIASANLEWLAESGIRAPVEVVIRNPDAGPGKAASWRSRCGAQFHHYVDAQTTPAALARLARLVSGRGLCLVLGGGGARGFAHLGLLRALKERDVPIDAVGGTSMGAFIAAMVACDMDLDRMLAVLRDTFVEHNHLNDYSMSRISLITGRKFREQLERLFGDTRIEDLALPFYCLSANITTGEAMVHDHGRLVDWVGTSMAVPGIAPPTVLHGELLVDGGVLRNLPVATMLTLGRGHILASDVSQGAPLRYDTDVENEPESLLDLPDARKQINIFKILFQTATLSNDRETGLLNEDMDLLVQMPVAGVGLFDWERLDDIVYRAYHHAHERLDIWLAKAGNGLNRVDGS